MWWYREHLVLVWPSSNNLLRDQHTQRLLASHANPSTVNMVTHMDLDIFPAPEAPIIDTRLYIVSLWEQLSVTCWRNQLPISSIDATMRYLSRLHGIPHHSALNSIAQNSVNPASWLILIICFIVHIPSWSGCMIVQAKFVEHLVYIMLSIF